MANNTEISWTDATWNPLAGCTWASSGCDHCYAAIMARRLEFMAQADIEAGRDPGRKRKYIGITNKNSAGRIMFNGTVNLDPAALNEPFTWKKPRRVFVNSMSDLFHKDVPFAFVAEVFNTMRRAHQHTFQVLTKRPERMAQFFAEWVQPGYVYPNVWLGTSVENQEQADRRVPHLLNVPARVRFLSCEPLLGAVDLWRFDEEDQALRGVGIIRSGGMTPSTPDSPPEGYDDSYPGIDWIICGGESGPGARPMDSEWARSLRDQAQVAGVAFHFKQWGAWVPAYSRDGDPFQLENKEYFDTGETWPHPRVHVWENWRTHNGDYAGYHCRASVNVGKHAAGRLLDGREWSEFPQ